MTEFNDINQVKAFFSNNAGKSLSDFLPVEDIARPGNGVAYAVADGSNLNMTQLRKFFEKIKNIEKKVKNKRLLEDAQIPEDILSEIALLSPQLAYAKGRRLVDENFYEIIKNLLTRERLKKRKDFDRLVEFFKAVVAYLKYLGQ